jgi:hypothetical protein
MRDALMVVAVVRSMGCLIDGGWETGDRGLRKRRKGKKTQRWGEVWSVPKGHDMTNRGSGAGRQTPLEGPCQGSFCLMFYGSNFPLILSIC